MKQRNNNLNSWILRLNQNLTISFNSVRRLVYALSEELNFREDCLPCSTHRQISNLDRALKHFTLFSSTLPSHLRPYFPANKLALPLSRSLKPSELPERYLSISRVPSRSVDLRVNLLILPCHGYRRDILNGNLVYSFPTLVLSESIALNGPVLLGKQTWYFSLNLFLFCWLVSE